MALAQFLVPVGSGEGIHSTDGLGLTVQSNKGSISPDLEKDTSKTLQRDTVIHSDTAV